MHDTSRLPHLHEEKEIEDLFPRIEAAAQVPNDEDWQPDGDEPGGPERQSKQQSAGRSDLKKTDASREGYGAGNPGRLSGVRK